MKDAFDIYAALTAIGLGCIAAYFVAVAIEKLRS